MQCPCCSGKPYTACCKPYHDGTTSPPTPLALMRSRYTAYALGNAAYIMKTTHPQSPYFEADRKKWEKAILSFCHTTVFEKLEICATGDHWVHFIAHLRQLEPLLLEEKSQFEQLNGQWLYLKGDFRTEKKS